MYIRGKAYIINNPTSDTEKFLSQVISILNLNCDQITQGKIGHLYKESLEYMDTPRDKQVLKGIMAILSNISFTSRMEGKISI